jgi:hypothetical protein
VVALGNPHRLAEAAGNRHLEAQADNHRMDAAAEVDSYQEVEAGSYQEVVAVDRSWTPSSVKLAGNERAYPNLRDA